MYRRNHIDTVNNSDNKPEISYLKGFSIFTIMLAHFIIGMPDVPEIIRKVSLAGGTGVHVFFLCSGTGLYLSYLKKKPSYVIFIKNRFRKIYFPYIIIAAISFFFPYMYNGNDRFAALLSHIFLFKMFVEKYECSFGGQFWFMSTIIQLYLLFIPMCRLKEKIRNNCLFQGLFLSISIIWWFFCYSAELTDVRIWNSFCFQYIWEFSLGFLIAEALSSGKIYHFNKKLLLLTAVSGIGLQAGLALTSEKLKVFNDIPAVLGYVSLALLLRNDPFITTITGFFSGISYECYLVHVLIYTTVFYLSRPTGIMMQSVAAIFAFIAAAGTAYAYHFIILRINNRFFSFPCDS